MQFARQIALRRVYERGKETPVKGNPVSIELEDPKREILTAVSGH
jgi:hypothetical protein